MNGRGFGGEKVNDSGAVCRGVMDLDGGANGTLFQGGEVEW